MKNNSKALKHEASYLDPDALAELAAETTTMLDIAGMSMLRECCWAVQAHCSARGFAGRWDRIEVPELLECWARSYRLTELLSLLELWMRLTAWLGDLALLPEPTTWLYREESLVWIRAQALRGRAFRALGERFGG